jgi:small subunit ribosomal protein S1
METDALALPETAQDTVQETAQETAQDIGEIKRKQHFTGTVVKTTLAGAVIDIGLDTPGVVHISQLQTEPVNRVEDVIQPGQQVDVWVYRVVPKKKRIELTMIRPLDLEWREIEPDMVLKGKVTRLEKFGAFVDIGAERPGLVHISEMAHDYIKSPGDFVKEGDEVEVKVLSVDRKKKQIKLSMKALQEPPVKEVREAPARESRGGRSSESVVHQVDMEEDKEEAVPTAMEIALREAMERSRDQRGDKGKGKPKTKGTPDELERILSRTLQQKVKTK